MVERHAPWLDHRVSACTAHLYFVLARLLFFSLGRMQADYKRRCRNKHGSVRSGMTEARRLRNNNPVGQTRRGHWAQPFATQAWLLSVWHPAVLDIIVLGLCLSRGESPHVRHARLRKKLLADRCLYHKVHVLHSCGAPPVDEQQPGALGGANPFRHVQFSV